MYISSKISVILSICGMLEIVIGTLLGTHEDARYKSESKKSVLKSVDIVGLGTGPELEKKLKYAEDVSYAVVLGRELVNSPANVLTPGLYNLYPCTLIFFFLSCS